MELKEKTTLEKYVYEIIDNGKPKEVTIEFNNNEFSQAIFPFKNYPYTREQWEILGEIEAEICLIEVEKENRPSQDRRNE